MDTLAITTKLELNMLIPQADFRAITDFAIKHRCPAIVIAPEFAPMMLVDRSAKNGQYKIIAAIDFPHGKNFCHDKFKTLNPLSLEVDGMDILLTKNKTEIELRNEVKSLTEFIRGSINSMMSIRYVLGCYNNKWEDVQKLLSAAQACPPDMIRMDQHLDLPNVDAEAHTQMLAKLRAVTPKTVKVSGNVNLEIIQKILEIDRNVKFDVSIKQATSLINQMKKQ